MLTQKQISEIREHLEKSQNPLFFFDNDADGLAAFLILSRHIGRGKGIAIKSFPDLNASYARKLHELKPDYIFVLDKPMIEKGFLDEAKQLSLPVVWIDHHDLERENTTDTFYYNPANNKGKDKSMEPVTYLAYKITNSKDLWIALFGCVGDGYLPDFYSEVQKQYSELLIEKPKNAFHVVYETEFGKLVRMLSFALKDRTSNVVKMLKFLLKVKTPHDVLEENPKNQTIHRRFTYVNDRHEKLLDKAKQVAKKSDKVLFFQYGGELSISADIANELSYFYSDKIIMVAYIKGTKANVSIRGKDDIKVLTEKAIQNLEGATGGGHKNACGAQVQVEDLPKFKENFVKAMK